MRGNKRAIEVLNANPVLSDAQEAALIALRESCFASEDFREGVSRLRREAQAELARPMSGGDAKALAGERPGDGGADRAGRRIDLETRLQPAQRGAARRRLRRAAAGDRRPAALDQSGAHDLRPRPRPLRRLAPRPRSSCSTPTSDDLRGAGLSGRKVEYLRDLAAHVLSGELELDRLDELADEEAIEEIVAVRGLGQWTAEMFLIFHLERPDVLSGGDLGIRKAIQIEYGLDEMPTPQEVVEIGERWSPHRSLASLYLWESLAAVPAIGLRRSCAADEAKGIA